VLGDGGVTLPPGQHARSDFPRFGTHLWRPPPAVPAEPAIAVTGAVTAPVRLTLADLAALPRREQTADFHCVSGWSATGLRWEGVPFAAFYERVIEPVAEPGVTHLAFRALDGYRSVLAIEDALGDDVLIAEHLDGRPLSSDHGAPLRLVSPSQYGFMSTKHLCGIEVHTDALREDYGHLDVLGRVALRTALAPHPRARVWEEERHARLPGPVVRPLFRLLIAPFRFLSARGSRPDG
jgi:DMSO/TMAO reductase YedYZ molybdopterin-dependent catalytic subunit